MYFSYRWLLERALMNSDSAFAMLHRMHKNSIGMEYVSRIGCRWRAPWVCFLTFVTGGKVCVYALS